MKAMFAILAGSIIFGMSGIAFAGGCGGGDGSSCGGGGEACDPYQSSCQCTDPMCDRPWYSDCISRAYCCEAFGNVGAR